LTKLVEFVEIIIDSLFLRRNSQL